LKIDHVAFGQRGKWRREASGKWRAAGVWGKKLELNPSCKNAEKTEPLGRPH